MSVEAGLRWAEGLPLLQPCGYRHAGTLDMKKRERVLRLQTTGGPSESIGLKSCAKPIVAEKARLPLTFTCHQRTGSP
jgi:hypothetical protein